MGASGWSYYVPYDADFAAALADLQQQVFERGEYSRSGWRKPKTIAQLRERAAEGGTHSILDITHIGPRPAQPGECRTDSDCPSGGCTPPNPIARPQLGSTCNEGSVGSGCQNDAACQSGLFCAEVGSTSTGYVFQTCGECDPSVGCAGNSLCNPSFEGAASRAVNRCVAQGSLVNGITCESDAACASGFCTTLVFPEGSEVGVCSHCSLDSDCAPGLTCTSPSFHIDAGFEGAECLSDPLIL